MDSDRFVDRILLAGIRRNVGVDRCGGMGNSIADCDAIDGPLELRLGETIDGRGAAQQLRCVEDLVVVVLGRAQEEWRYVNRSLTGYAGGAVGLLFEIQLYGPLLPRQDRKWIVRLERSGLTDRENGTRNSVKAA